MFNINPKINVNVDYFHNSPIFTIDNFYEDPDSIVNYLLSVEAPLWKMDEQYQPSHNGIYFEDRKHQIECKEIEPVYYFLQSICGQYIHYLEDIDTNVMKFYKDSFNDYENNYWMPHNDLGYTAIIYLNDGDEESGTNLYECLVDNEPPMEYSEHYYPWRPKERYKLLRTLKPKYNRMIMFDGKKFLHGANICNQDYFGDTFRLNQVYFFESDD